ncbi:MAG: hypothetical protein PHD01_01690 [Geobacteraceae bacterium]|nr:hypothetical protein [Geobacteraceae bacterium]
MKTRVKLKPGQKGTKKLTAQYGDTLVCVLYRYDVENRNKIKTVEIIVDESDWTPTKARYPAGAMGPYGSVRRKSRYRSRFGNWVGVGIVRSISGISLTLASQGHGWKSLYY